MSSAAAAGASWGTHYPDPACLNGGSPNHSLRNLPTARCPLQVSTAGKTVFQVNADIQGLQMAHFAFQAQATGWIALALTARPGKMYPADAVLGYVNPDGQGSVQSFYLRNNFPTFNDAFGGWASYMGVVQASGRTWVCFSRRLVEPTAPGVKNITTDGNENGGTALLTPVAASEPAVDLWMHPVLPWSTRRSRQGQGAERRTRLPTCRCRHGPVPQLGHRPRRASHGQPDRAQGRRRHQDPAGGRHHHHWRQPRLRQWRDVFPGGLRDHHRHRRHLVLL